MKLYVPIMAETLNEKSDLKYADYLKRIKADVVFIAPSRESLFMDEDESLVYWRTIANHAVFFKSQGFEIGIWIDSFGFGGRNQPKGFEKAANEPRITSVTGKADFALCPEGDGFVGLCGSRIKKIALIVKPDRIMIDDEMCLSVRPGLGCFCEKHMKLYAEKFGKEYTREQLNELIFTGYNEKFRKGYLEVVGDSMRRYCKKMRAALDEVAPNMRMGFCAGYTSWDIEGADAIELTKILAGNTKPFLRFSGAPYWVARTKLRFPGQTLNDVVDYTRMQEKWCEGSGVEVFHECDTYPRPRYYIPANLCEAFDIALVASGNMGRLKYLFCYDTAPDREDGYVKRHIRNMPLCEFIEKHFDGKKTVGVKVCEEMHKFKTMWLKNAAPKGYAEEKKIMETTFSPAAHLISSHSIPVSYGENPDVAAVFGENARYVEKLSKKMIVDIVAARILKERGYDLGILNIEDDSESVGTEKFKDTLAFSLWDNISASRCSLKDGVSVDSVFITANGDEFPSSFRYDNGETEFLVFAFDGYGGYGTSRAFLSYYRQEQLLDFIGEKYPFIKGNPFVYTICKEDENERAVLFCNFSEDELFDFDVNLDREYADMELFGAKGEMKNKKIKIDSNVSAYGAFAVILKK